ncbi:zinc-binding alcohol dehydrogenase family protein [Olivibacter sp. SDN3]|uniref:zinc-binding alcohol dehydrogenase family protein n=1 Tax=Olivibacter sp. SDN3 TaxID=2764720 RepID=UPI00165116B4|nr:zinc-binding alcohol dehydrogenase family protein [Olivibacter sp. SDN3]QNL48659.1 zinc-binding alcohol dehydrogenase family protein [Olivibacter sp. SDN3]
MISISCVQPGQLKLTHSQKPSLKPDHSILKIKSIGICGTDLHAFEGIQPYFEYPRILGHEIAAEIAETEKGSGFTIGERVTVIPYLHCDNCIACRNGKTNCCVDMQVIGVHCDGGMQEYICVPNPAIVKGASLSFNELMLIEPLAIGAHGIRRAAIKSGEHVLVIGAGPIGLGVMEIARIAGAEVVAMDINNQRLAFCKDKLAISHTINPLEASPIEKLEKITSGNMPTVVIDCTGNLQAINNAFQYIAHGGRYVLIGLQKEFINFSHPEFHKREATLMSSRNATRTDFDYVISCMQRQYILPTHYITHQVGFEDVEQVFPSWLDPASAVIKAMVKF